MSYKYSTPHEAVISLEEAYTNKDLDAIILSKDFKSEAKIMLERSSYNYDLSDDALILETAKLLELSLIKSLQDNGYPDFTDARREFSELETFKANVFAMDETVSFPDGTEYVNKILLSSENGEWKIVMIEEED